MTETFQIPDALLARCVGREDLVQRVVASFVEQMTTDIPELTDNVNSGNCEATRKLAHRIKGSSANVDAESIRTTAAEVESLAGEDRLDEAKASIVLLEKHWQDYVILTSTFVSE